LIYLFILLACDAILCALWAAFRDREPRIAVAPPRSADADRPTVEVPIFRDIPHKVVYGHTPSGAEVTLYKAPPAHPEVTPLGLFVGRG
jgi:hypothetical protein